MTSITQAITKFIQPLSARELTWLERLRCHAQQSAPNDWLKFYADPLFLGWLSPKRANQLVAALPYCTIQRDRLVWSCSVQNSLHRSRDLQNFLKSQAANGRLPGWRNEFFCFWETPTCPPDVDSPPFFCIERAGFRHLGLMSHAVHINGFLPNGDVWCARRAMDKTTDPGMLDNLTAGGLSAGETALTTAVRELQEEAGLDISQSSQLKWAGAIRMQRLASEGWHDENLLVYNLVVSEQIQPRNVDGEVQEFLRLTPTNVIARMQAGEFTQDACMALAVGLNL
jgi:8-oxo-dGTP pyrophosphatase MutT (NUDIX family)